MAQVIPDARRRRIPTDPAAGNRTTDTVDTGRASIGEIFPNYMVIGKVVDAATGEPLPGATLRLKDNFNGAGALADYNGAFILRLPTTGYQSVIVSYIGYNNRILTVKPGLDTVRIALTEGNLSAEEVVISASRMPQQIKETSVSISKLSLSQLQSSSSLNFYEALNISKELEGVSVGIGYKVYNARGFLAVINNRFSQRFDGIESTIPGNNASVGNLLGPPDLDIENAEILVGSASVLYGSNAINGLLNLRTRSPFDYTGLSYSVRTGVSHVGQADQAAAPLFEAAMRYARKISDRWAYKIVLSGFRADDWIGTNTTDGANYSGTTNDLQYRPGPGNPGYDGTNLYGDALSYTFSFLNFLNFPGKRPIEDPNVVLRVARTGYTEQAITDNQFSNYKFGASLHHRFGNNELIMSTNVAFINAMTPLIQRNQLNDYLFHQHRLELSGPRFFLRGYGSFQRNSRMVDLVATGNAINRSYKSDINWFIQYLSVFYSSLNGDINAIRQQNGLPPIPTGSDAAARAFAESDNSYIFNALQSAGNPLATYFVGGSRLLPGSSEFTQALATARNTNSNSGSGGRVEDYTGQMQLEGQYDLSKSIKWMTAQVGGSMRSFLVNSNGSFYIDKPGQNLFAYDYGAYVNLSKKLADDRFTLQVSGRMDGARYIGPVFSPRVAITYAADDARKGFLRASFQRTKRLPNLVQQFQDLNLGIYRQTNTLPETYNRYGLQNNNFTLTSVKAFTNTFQEGDQNPSLLQTFVFQPLRSETITSWELGFRTTMRPGNTYLDIALFYNDYQDFIGLIPLVGPRYTPGQTPLQLSPTDVLDITRVENYQVWANIPDNYVSFGYSLGLQLDISDVWMANGNMSFIRFEQLGRPSNIGLVDAYNTPRYKANLGITGRHFWKKASVGLTYRWVDSFEYVVPNFTGFVPAYNLVDASVSYDFQRSGFQLKLGGSNILNHRHVEVTFGPNVGAVYYLQLTFDPLIFKR